MAREGPDWRSNSIRIRSEVVEPCYVEPSLASAAVGSHFQFERLGYFCVDPDSTARETVFNRTVTLKDTWAKIEKREEVSWNAPGGRSEHAARYFSAVEPGLLAACAGWVMGTNWCWRTLIFRARAWGRV